MNTEKAIRQLETAIRARLPVIAVESDEEDRILRVINQFCGEPMMTLDGENVAAPPRLVFAWTTTAGVQIADPRYRHTATELEAMSNEPNSIPRRYALWERERPQDTHPSAAIQHFMDWATGDGTMEQMEVHASVLIMCDVHRFLLPPERGGLGDIDSIRCLRDAHSRLQPTKSHLIILAPDCSSLGDSAGQVPTIRWPLPSIDELADMVKTAAARIRGVPVKLNGETEQLAQALAGVTFQQASQILRQAIVDAGELTLEACAPRIMSMKADVLQEQQGVELIQPRSIDEVGGLDLLKQAVKGYPRLLSAEARERGIRPPKAVLLAGPAGTGKSLTAQVVGGGVLPILRWSPAQSKSKWVGESTSNVVKVLQAADAIDFAVLWVDEIDMALPHEGRESHEVSEEVLQTLLTWMQERKSSVIMVMTTNHPGRLPDPFLDRIAERWFVDLPTQVEARAILDIHLGKRGLSLPDEALDSLAKKSASGKLNGRGIENAVEAANNAAFLAGTDLTEDLLAEQLDTRILMSQKGSDTVERMRQDCSAWARPASSKAPLAMSRAQATEGATPLVDL